MKHIVLKIMEIAPLAHLSITTGIVKINPFGEVPVPGPDANQPAVKK